jgi:hypothetical protein
VRIGPLACASAALLIALTGCTESAGPPADGAADAVVTVDPPEAGQCRILTPADVAEPDNDTEPVPCTAAHTAETYLVGAFEGKAARAGYDDPVLGAQVFRSCDRRYRRFTGADESLALRSVLSWAWFRPSEAAWEAGARWYRCDVVGGGEASAAMVGLPRTTEGILLGRPGDRWMACVDGETVTGAPRVPCTEEHTWRAVSAVVVGEEEDEYPGDRLVEVLTRDYCSDWVGAWMSYPIDYEFAYTWFHEGEWQAGNRRSVCWAKTAD